MKKKIKENEEEDDDVEKKNWRCRSIPAAHITEKSGQYTNKYNIYHSTVCI